jgi:hypothetical protein
MATHTRGALGQSNAEYPDPSYAIAAGLYVAALLAPVVVLILSLALSDAAVLYLSFLGAVAGIAVVAGWSVSRIRGLAVSLGGNTAVRLLAVFPLVWSVGVFGSSAVGREVPDIAGPLAVVGTGGGFLLGLLLIALSRSRYAMAVLTDAEEFAQWEARWPRRWRYLSLVGMVVAVVAGGVGIIVQFVFGVDWAGSIYYLMFIWTPLAGAANPRTFRVTAAGLVVERSPLKRFQPWSAIKGYTLTNDALIIQTTAWWRPAYRSDREDVEELNTIVASLDEMLIDHK